MFKQVTSFFLKSLGKKTAVSDSVPDSLLFRNLVQRFLMLVRGRLRLGVNIFLGRGVRIRGRQLAVGQFSTIGSHCFIDTLSTSGVKIGEGCNIGEYSRVLCSSNFEVIGGGLSIGDNSGFGEFCFFGCAGGVHVGRDVIAGQFVSFHSENHIFEISGLPIREQGVTHEGIRIADNVWIGSKVTFLDGSEIESNSVVAAGSVVRGKFPAGSVIAGVPARVVKKI